MKVGDCVQVPEVCLCGCRGEEERGRGGSEGRMNAGSMRQRAINGETPTSRVTDMGTRGASQSGVISEAKNLISPLPPLLSMVGAPRHLNSIKSTASLSTPPLRSTHFAGKASKYGESASSFSSRRLQATIQLVINFPSTKI